MAYKPAPDEAKTGNVSAATPTRLAAVHKPLQASAITPARKPAPLFPKWVRYFAIGLAVGVAILVLRTC